MSRRGLELYGELFPPGTTRNAEYWARHIGIIENYSGSAEHLGIMSALLDERLHFFRQEPDSRNGLLLVLVCTASWELIRTLAGIGKDERDWLRKKYTQFEDHIYQENWADAIRFMEQMHSLYEIQTFMRHPSQKLREYSWVFDDKWPAGRITLIADAAEDLSTVIGLAYNEFSINAGWEGERPEKQALHDAAMQEEMV